MVLVYVVRHGTTDYNLQGLWQGELDTELAQQGIEEAEAQACDFLEQQSLSFDACYCSSLKRAHRTAEILAAPHPGCAVTPTSALREPCLGEFQGLHKEVIHGPK